MSAPWDTIDGIRGPNPGVPQVRAVHHDTFVTYRPLSACRFCQKKIEKEMEDDDYTPPETEQLCPHVRKDALDALLARGVRQEVIDLRMTTNVLPSGIVQVTVMWSEVTGTKIEAESPRPSRL
jgi:hypothetical protein